MTQRFALPGLDGSQARALMGRGAAVAPPSGPDFTLSNTTVATAWGVVTVGELIPIGVDPGDVIFEIVETAGPSGDEAGLAVVNG